MKQLLVDTIVFDVKPQQLKEAAMKGDGRLIVTGVLQRANEKNQNGRVYPESILKREVQKYKGREIKENRAYGELDVELKNTSHIIRDIWWDGTDVVGKVEILNTPAGRILKELVEAGCTVGISSRGMGSVRQIKEDGTVAVEGDFDLICWDFVSNPSTHGAFLKPVNEGVNRNVNNVNKYQKANDIMRDIICEIGGYCECNFGETK